ncbi:UDP-glucose 4-epimerase, partial [Candidatus Pacearchaeota archaeon]|nr:UDP-glucose 4-epimerase [Candidatus Pacearchaeota archaeon]
METVIVTGSAGFIGGHLTEDLLKKGYKVIGIDNLKSGLQSTVDLHISYDNFIPKYVDIRSNDIDKIFRDFNPDFVFHLAAIPGVVPSVKDPFISNSVNVEGTVNILDVAQKHNVKRVIFSSSSSVYGGAEE